MPFRKVVSQVKITFALSTASTLSASLQELMYAMDHILDALERGGWVYVNDST